MDDMAEARLAKLEARIKALEDHIEITQLATAYGPSVDNGSLTDAPALWKSDGVYDVIGYRRMEGQEDISDMLTGPGHQEAIMNGCGHVLTVPHIEISGDEATGRSYSMMIRWDEEAQRFWVFRLSATRWLWHRTSAGWRIANRTNRLLNGDAEARAMMAPDSRVEALSAAGTESLGNSG